MAGLVVPVSTQTDASDRDWTKHLDSRQRTRKNYLREKNQNIPKVSSLMQFMVFINFV